MNWFSDADSRRMMVGCLLKINQCKDVSYEQYIFGDLKHFAAFCIPFFIVAGARVP